ncbi:ThiF family adenylyltransferase [Escherichia coli]|uniref:ThiF family adenylyltransferase n=3 Tax=Enterobacteriaceae TaxID=543 RepID=UPI001F2C367E|nr:ThiF family adenylyltransferase [Escherichia coli]MCF1523480.1 ThiF family adenylyltransferase [Escherichia coli]MCF1579268.1 ThiF family adenylyltransferase [Escherichia coli]MCF7436468.1 ThiF family adenylyltransferase [Escherichia coli]
MPDCLKKKIEQLNKILAPYGARKLSNTELSILDEKYICVWELPTDLVFNDDSIVLQIRYKSLTQHDIPEVFVSSPAINVCQLPHIEKNGKLCVWPNTYIIDLSDNSYVLELLSDAYSMLKKGIKGDLRDDFIDEFQNYWIYHCNKIERVISLCDLNIKNTRLVYGYKAKTLGWIYSDGEQKLINWLDNQKLLSSNSDNSNARDKNLRQRQLSRIISIPLIFFENAWYPEQYPRTIRDLFNLINEYHNEPDIVDEFILKSIANIYNRNPTVLIAFPTPSGMNIIGIRISENVGDRHTDRYDTRAIANGRFHINSLLDGHRDYINGRILKNRIGDLKAQNILVERNDNSWIMGRDHNPTYKKISEHTVAIIGCGSVGSSISRLLIQSGITNIMLWDEDSMKSENSSRHLLGFDSVNKNKASALASKLRLEFPNTNIEYFNEEWSENAESSTRITEADLILSCTADWNTEQQLLSKQSQCNLGVLVFAFVEAHAMAGHVIVNQIDSGAFNAWHYTQGEKIGALRYPATYWKENTKKRIAACAGEFQPYGAIPLANLHSLAARTIIDLILNRFPDSSFAYSYLGRQEELVELGGQWNDCWINKFGNPNKGDRIISLIYENSNWMNNDA